MNFFPLKNIIFSKPFWCFTRKSCFTIPQLSQEDSKTVMNISAKGTADRLGLKNGWWISFLCSPSLPVAEVARKQHSHPLDSLKGSVGFIFISRVWDPQNCHLTSLRTEFWRNRVKSAEGLLLLLVFCCVCFFFLLSRSFYCTEMPFSAFICCFMLYGTQSKMLEEDGQGAEQEFLPVSLAWNNLCVLSITYQPSHHIGILVPSSQMVKISSSHLPKLCSGYREEDPASLLSPAQAPSRPLDPSENNSHTFSVKRGGIYISLCCYLQPLEDVKILRKKYLLIFISSVMRWVTQCCSN